MPGSLRARLEEAAAGLLYVSESEAPFRYMELAWPPGAPVDARAVTAALRERDFARETGLAEFLAGHLDAADPADPVAQAQVPRFRALVTVLTESLRAPRVYCFGETEKRCYLLGEAGQTLAGLRTTAFES